MEQIGQEASNLSLSDLKSLGIVKEDKSASQTFSVPTSTTVSTSQPPRQDSGNFQLPSGMQLLSSGDSQTDLSFGARNQQAQQPASADILQMLGLSNRQQSSGFGGRQNVQQASGFGGRQNVQQSLPFGNTS